MAGILFLIVFIVIMFFVIKNSFKLLVNFELNEGEELVQQIKGDCWPRGLVFRVQRVGEVAFTTNRVIFQGTQLTSCASYEEMNYSDIASVETCFVGPFIPTGIKLTSHNHEILVLSVLGRKKYIELIKGLMQKSQSI